MFRDFYNKFLEKLHASGWDVKVFIASLLLAFTIWLIYNLSLNYSDTVSITVLAHSNIEGHAPVASNTSEVVARCNTTGFKLLGLNHFSTHNVKDLYIESKDFENVSGDDYRISSDNLNTYLTDIFGEGVSIEYVLAKDIRFRFPYENNKKVPVQVVSTISYKPQYMASGKMHIQPDSVIIYGEPFHLENIDRVYTDPINLSDLSYNAHGVANIEEIYGIRMSETKVNYSIEVSRFVGIKTEVSIVPKNFPPGKKISIYPSTAQVVYHCVFPITEDPVDEVTFYIDYEDFENSINGRCVARASEMPEGVLDYYIDPQVFECIEEEGK